MRDSTGKAEDSSPRFRPSFEKHEYEIERASHGKAKMKKHLLDSMKILLNIDE